MRENNAQSIVTYFTSSPGIFPSFWGKAMMMMMVDVVMVVELVAVVVVVMVVVGVAVVVKMTKTASMKRVS